MAAVEQRLLLVLEMFRAEANLRDGIQNKLGLTALEVFMAIASKKNGLSIGELIDRLGIAQSVASRNVSLLSEKQYAGGRGMRLVESSADPLDSRRIIVTLSKSGRRLLSRIKETLE